MREKTFFTLNNSNAKDVKFCSHVFKWDSLHYVPRNLVSLSLIEDRMNVIRPVCYLRHLLLICIKYRELFILFRKKSTKSKYFFHSINYIIIFAEQFNHSCSFLAVWTFNPIR